MPNDDWGALKPGQVADWINFDARDAKWHYLDCEKASMPAKQAEGVAAIWNSLALQDLALLADEVGMGKTLQALGVIALLFEQNPDARILIMSPNNNICLHWIREYRSFLEHHFKHIPSVTHTPQLCTDLNNLVDMVKTGAQQFLVAKISSLSRLVSDKDGDVLAKAEQAAQVIHDELKIATGGKGFDLIVVDEAHYFRNAHAHSQRAGAARKFFGAQSNRLGSKVLLLTATPSHSHLGNVANILGYFVDLGPGAENLDPGALLNKYSLRRLRQMQGAQVSHNKYSYRNEMALPASFENNPEAEMFFAMYQKKLVQQQGKDGHKRRYLYGYLEGFESTGGPRITSKSSEEKTIEVAVQAFEGAADTKILQQLTEMHRKAFNDYPNHPKYGALIKQCIPVNLFSSHDALHEHKHLVFVRRIPSVHEITQRINSAYDQLFAQQIVKACIQEKKKQKQVLDKWKERGWSRSYFNRFISPFNKTSTMDESLMEATEIVDNEAPDEDMFSSGIANLFVVKKKGDFRSTNCSNFSLRLRKPESLFSLLLAPASDYRMGEYETYYRKTVGNKDRDDYANAARDFRLTHYDGSASNNVVQPNEDSHPYTKSMPTLWGLIYPLLSQKARASLETWLDTKNNGFAIAENFGNYVRTGFLFASPVIIELYCWFTSFFDERHRSNVQKDYLEFIDWIKLKLPDSLLLHYFEAALETFEQLCDKITDHDLHDYKSEWRVFTSLQNPAWYASGETNNRERLITGFNSPFYPNVLIATSVFQEGVNLHLQCSKVHHYGIAWTPGDNEQRVGRVDRLFGRVNQQLLEHGDAELTIHYPYLTRSFDQEQLASFIVQKHDVESRLDACKHINFSDEIDVSKAIDGWEKFLRKPVKNHSQEDPYPARFDPDRMPAHTYCAANERSPK
ncbi:MAG: DEAD/DEAH box helicase [Pseudomonadota bacterium]